MAILEEEVSFLMNSTNLTHYETKGYELPKYIDNNNKVRVKKIPITVKTEDLHDENTIKITRICDKCNKKTPNVIYRSLLLSRKKHNGIDLCKECSIKLVGENRKNNVKYKNSAEYYCKENNMEFLMTLFSDKNDRTMDKITYGSGDVFIWNCAEYGDTHEHLCTMTNKLNSPHGCSYCNGYAINSTNCISTTHPKIAEMLWDYKESQLLTFGMGKKVNFKCSSCGEKVNRSLSYVVKKGYVHCKVCSDFTSYPEKIMFNVLKQLNMDFTTEVFFEWSGRKRFDFYIPSLNCIIETHGNQHYEEGFESLKGRTLEEEQENDRLKEKLAKENGIDKYIVIDCRESDVDWIKDKVIKSKLSSLFILDNIDWDKCHLYACDSLVKEVSRLWNKGNMTANNISKIILKSKDSTIRLLKKATKANLCDYDAKEEQSKTALLLIEKKKKPVIQLSLNKEYISEFESIREASRKIKRDHNTILRVVNGKQKTAGGYKWMYKEDYNRYIDGLNKKLIHI